MPKTKHNLAAEKDVEEAILCFLYENKYRTPDASQTIGEYENIQYNQEALKDAMIVIMGAFGCQIKDNG